MNAGVQILAADGDTNLANWPESYVPRVGEFVELPDSPKPRRVLRVVYRLTETRLGDNFIPLQVLTAFVTVDDER